MRIALIGTSGSGKSHWSSKLEEEFGFKRFSCDELIEEKLKTVLDGTGIHALAAWMGEPYEEHYAETSKKYLEFEEEVLKDIVEILKSSSDEKIVVDTTGSFIYTSEKIRAELKKLSKTVYLEVPTEARDEVFELYFSDPKPIIWGNSFNMQEGEDKKKALARCYHDLMEFRTAEYEKHADITIPYSIHKSEKFTTSDLYDKIK